MNSYCPDPNCKQYLPSSVQLEAHRSRYPGHFKQPMSKDMQRSVEIQVRADEIAKTDPVQAREYAKRVAIKVDLAAAVSYAKDAIDLSKSIAATTGDATDYPQKFAKKVTLHSATEVEIKQLQDAKCAECAHRNGNCSVIPIYDYRTGKAKCKAFKQRKHRKVKSHAKKKTVKTT